MNYGKNEINQFVKRVCLLIAVILLSSIFILLASDLLRRKDSERKYADFFENADKVDVLFFGSSHMLNSVSPAQLYDETGITSYNMAKPGGIMIEAYWTYKLARQYVRPKCVVVDLWSLDRDYHYVDLMNGPEDREQADNSVALLHTNLDAFPLSATKVRAVNDLISSFDRRMEFLFDFSIYHGRWSQIQRDDFENGQFGGTPYLLGAEANRDIITDYNMFEPEDKTGNFDKETESIRYLLKLIKECQEDGTEVILTFMPMGGSYYQDFQAVNFGKKLAKKFDIEFVNLLDEDQEVVDLDFDMSDSSHVNEFGMSKITHYLGQILKEGYDLANHTGEAGCEIYEEAAKFLKKQRLSMLKEEDDLYMTLGYLDMLESDCAVLFKSGSSAFKDSTVLEMTDQLSQSKGVHEAKNQDGPYFLLKQHLDDKSEATVYERIGLTDDDGIKTNKGEGEYLGLSNFAAFYIDGDLENNLFDMEEHSKSDVQVAVLDKKGDVICKKYFNGRFTAVQE